MRLREKWLLDKLRKGWPGRAVYILICLGFLAFGGLRAGLSLGVLGQNAGLLQVDTFAGLILEVEDFMARHADQSLYAFGVADYFAYLAIMGLVLMTGAIVALFHRVEGIMLMALYLLMHAALFVNALVLNPKLILLGLTVALVALLSWLRPGLVRS